MIVVSPFSDEVRRLNKLVIRYQHERETATGIISCQLIIISCLLIHTLFRRVDLWENTININCFTKQETHKGRRCQKINLKKKQDVSAVDSCID